ncbi:MAG TPA: hypothetical protein VL307_06945 [Chitinophagaceae bacterium]|nr:hypothetical protein [Chitinophagaceae bacterium]
MAKEGPRKDLEHINLRSSFKVLQLSNPNYFGNLKDSQLKPVEQIAGNVFYEELKCVSYSPATQILHAAITVKQNGGYSGGPCTNGSFEYVRFYVDYLRNGTWIDEGVTSTNVHDLAFQESLCYNVQLKIDPAKKACCDDPAVLPRVRAILSWNSAPPANAPNWVPVWGNTMETNIQIAPSKSLWCLIKKGVVLDEQVKQQLMINIDKLQLALPPLPPAPDPAFSPQYFKRLYKEQVEDTRIALKYVNDLSNFTAFSSFTGKIATEAINWPEVLGKIKLLQFNTSYEEVKCVALNRELNSLHASVVIKKPGGYSGDLCTAGSKEYVAFYMDFGSGYQYMGTSSVAVHDINNMPADGLWYNIALPVNLQPHQKEWCVAGKAKLKAILSWNSAPPANNPNYVAPYGDWEECTVEIKSLPGGVVPGNSTVILEKVGGMVVDDINDATGLATTALAGSLGGAINSPFYGTMELIGHIFFALPAMSYRFMVTKPGGIELPLTDTQVITTDNLGTITDHTFNPGADGWIPYLQTGVVNIVGGLLGRYAATTEGKHIIRIQAKDIFNNIYNDPNGAVTITVDANAPAVQLHIDPSIGGDCADFTSGTDITGTYSMLDAHAGSFSISVTPDNGAVVDVDGSGGNGLSYVGGTLPNAGKTGSFVIHTNNVPKCGYNVRIDAWDRTIVNSHGIGLYNNDVQGFCLRLAGQ